MMKNIVLKYKEAIGSSRWAGYGIEHIEAHFFISHRGSHMQKSIEGLMRCLLHQICSKNEALARIALAEFAREEIEKVVFSTPTLRGLFDRIARQTEDDVAITCFIDALDEYDGPVQEIADLLRSMVQSHPNSKHVSGFASRVAHGLYLRIASLDYLILLWRSTPKQTSQGTSSIEWRAIPNCARIWIR